MSIESSNPATNTNFITEWWTPRLAGPVIAAAVVRLALLVVTLVRFGINSCIYSDTVSYLEPGRNLLLHGRFVADGVPDLVRTPGYPLFLAMTSLAGLPAAAVTNVILSVFSVILVWKLGRATFSDPRVALGAAWIFAFEPVSIIHSAALLSDTLFLALLMLSLERLAMFLRGRNLPVLAVAGLWLAAATFVRPVTYYLPAALALGLFLVLVRVPGLRWKAPAVLLISVLPWLAAWQMRNRVETGYDGFSSISEINLYFDDAADVTAHLEHEPFLDVRKDLGYSDFTNNSGQSYLFQPYLALHPEQAGWSQGQRLAFMHYEALRVIWAHYGVFLRNCLLDLFKMVIDRGSGPIYDLMNPGDPGHISGLITNEGLVHGAIVLVRIDPWMAAEKLVFESFLMGLYLLAARGIFRGGMHNPHLWLLLGTVLFFFAVSSMGTGPITGARFRLPVMPIVCILAAAGFWRTKEI
jgi:hypothetical protein